MDPQVRSLLALSGYPGMLVYQFSAQEMRHLPKDIAERKIFYTGTHDNQTLAGWCEEHSLPLDSTETIIRELYESPAAWVITPLQDLLGLGNESSHEYTRPEQRGTGNGARKLHILRQIWPNESLHGRQPPVVKR